MRPTQYEFDLALTTTDLELRRAAHDATDPDIIRALTEAGFTIKGPPRRFTVTNPNVGGATVLDHGSPIASFTNDRASADAQRYADQREREAR